MVWFGFDSFRRYFQYFGFFFSLFSLEKKKRYTYNIDQECCGKWRVRCSCVCGCMIFFVFMDRANVYTNFMNDMEPKQTHRQPNAVASQSNKMKMCHFF